MTQDISILGTITASGQTVQISTVDMGSVGIEVSGTWTGTLVPEVSIDGSNWSTVSIIPAGGAAAVTSMTANGIWQGNSAGFYLFRLRASAAITGTAVITLRASATAAAISLFSGGSVLGHVITDTGSVTNATIVGPLGQAVMASSVPVALASNQSSIPVAGTAAAGAAASGNPVQIGGVYNTSAPTPSNGQMEPLQLDSGGNLKTDEQFAPVYEDNSAGRALVEQRNSYANITSTTTTTVKSGAGFLHMITINAAAATGVITIYDNTAASGTKIGTITMPATLLANQIVMRYDVSFATGLTIVTGTAAQDITVSYR